MAFEFQKETKKQMMLIWVLAAVLLITAGVIWYGFLRKEKPIEIIPVVSTAIDKTVNIDTEILKSQELIDMELFGEFKPYEGEIGKENIFAKSSSLIVSERENENNEPETQSEDSTDEADTDVEE